MYNNAHGRFTAVDPLLASGKSANPQTFNRYVYTLNNPIIYADFNGEDVHVELSKDPIGKTQIRLIQPDKKIDSNIPDTVEVDVYSLKVWDDVNGKEAATYYNVTRDAPYLNSSTPVVKGGQNFHIVVPGFLDTETKLKVPDRYNVDNYAFEPKEDTTYILQKTSLTNVPNLPAYQVKDASKWINRGSLEAEPNGSPFRKIPNIATGVFLHVGGQFTDNLGNTRITGSEGCFTLSGGNEGIEAFNNDVQRRLRRQTFISGRNITYFVPKRNDVRWRWQVVNNTNNPVSNGRGVPFNPPNIFSIR